MAAVGVRYIVDAPDAAIAFYAGHLGFSVDMRPGRNDVVTGRGGKQVLLEDPAGNCVDLFEPAPRG